MPARTGPRFARLASMAVAGLAISAAGPASTALPTGAAVRTASPGTRQADLLTQVNPFIGTQNQGNIYPGAAAPFGMTQVSPDTGGSATGYDYGQSTIHGFSLTHLSGAGCGVDGEVPFMPTTGAVSTVSPSSYASSFSHSQEQAQPGYYEVELPAYGVKAELTATARTGWQRYTFPSTGQANVLINTGSANMHVFDSGLSIVGGNTVEGYVHAGHFCAGQDQHTVYFSAQFSRPFTAFGTWRGSTLSQGSRTASGTGGNGGWVTFGASQNAVPDNTGPDNTGPDNTGPDNTGPDNTGPDNTGPDNTGPDNTGPDNTVTVKTGVSYTGLAGARANLAAETGNSFNFDATRQVLQNSWNQMLNSIQVTGGSSDARTAFYTALYHSLLHPNVASDVTGQFAGFDGKVHQAADHTEYQNFSLWDTYRTQNQLLELLQPQVARDVDLSMLDVYRYGGWLPRWELDNSETNVMTGDPATPFLVDGWSKGLLAGHAEEAYQALLANVTSAPPASTPFNGRNGNPWYTTLGYIPMNEKCAYSGGDNDCQHPASATLEYAAADASLSIMAKALGHPSEAQMLAQRGENYRTLWDASIGFFRPRNQDGSWYGPYDPESGSGAFQESGAYQYQWLVPQDEPGMIGLLGGNAAANQRLDSFFDYSALLTDPSQTVKSGWVNSPYGYYGNKTYNPNNEPDLQSPYTYEWTGEPDHTATVVRAQETLFANAPNGMTGNDDMGEMSAWLVMSSLGLYPVMSGAQYYTVTSPQFPRAIVHLGAYGTQQGGAVVIDAPGTSWNNRYITGMTVGGHPHQQTWLSQAAISRGARISYTLAPSAGAWGTAPADVPPTVTSATG